MAALMPYLLVGIGGFLGANARFVLARAIDGPTSGTIPPYNKAVVLGPTDPAGVSGLVRASYVTRDAEVKDGMAGTDCELQIAGFV